MALQVPPPRGGVSGGGNVKQVAGWALLAFVMKLYLLISLFLYGACCDSRETERWKVNAF